MRNQIINKQERKQRERKKKKEKTNQPTKKYPLFNYISVLKINSFSIFFLPNVGKRETKREKEEVEERNVDCIDFPAFWKWATEHCLRILCKLFMNLGLNLITDAIFLHLVASNCNQSHPAGQEYVEKAGQDYELAFNSANE